MIVFAAATRRRLVCDASHLRTIRLLHCNAAGDGWTADSPDLEGWSVAGASFAETKRPAEAAVRSSLSEVGSGPAVTDIEITHHIACSR